MWEGKVTQELIDACAEYARINDGMRPDEYADIDYECLTYDQFLGLILEANAKKCDILDIY